MIATDAGPVIRLEQWVTKRWAVQLLRWPWWRTGASGLNAP